MAKDNFIKYLMEYYNKHNTINNIPRNAVVIYEGEKLAIGEFIASIRKQHKLYINGETSHGCASQTAINRYTVLDLYDFEWKKKKKKDKELEENDKALIYVINYYKKNKTLNGIEEKVIIDKPKIIDVDDKYKKAEKYLVYYMLKEVDAILLYQSKVAFIKNKTL